jgi:hypothetical protein
MSSFDSATPLLRWWFVDRFCLFLSVQKLFYSTVSFQLKSTLRAEILGIRGILRPLISRHISETPKSTSWRQTAAASFEPSYVLVRRSIRLVHDPEKKKFCLSESKKKVAESVYLTCGRDRPYPAGCNGSLHIC